jgi:hypothetical protein
MDTTEIVATVLTIAGFFLISEGILGFGFTLSFAANVLWIVWGHSKNARGIMVVNACLLLSSANGIMGLIV